HMDETSGSVMHDSVAGHDGTLFSVALGQPGFLGAAFGFNGSSSYVSVPSASDLNPGSSNITITIHLKTTSAPATPDWDLIRKGNAAPRLHRNLRRLAHVDGITWPEARHPAPLPTRRGPPGSSRSPTR